MRRLAVLALAIAALGCVALGDEREGRTIYVTFIAPESIEEMAQEADVVVRGRVLGSQAVAGERTGKRLEVYTEHRLRILEVIGGWIPAEPQQRHDEMLLLQRAGEVETEDGPIRIADEVPLSPGSEYVLFLTWNPGYQRYEPSHGSYAIFKVENGTMQPASNFPPRCTRMP